MARFPAIEPEPAPPSLGRRAARGAAVLAVLAGAVTAAVVLTDALRDEAGQATARPSPSVAALGRVVVVDGLRLSIADSRGRLQRPLTSDLQIDPSFLDLALDPTGRRATTGPGAGFGGSTNLLVDLTAPGTTRAVPAAPVDLLRGGSLAEAPWADGGRGLVLLTGDRLDRVGLVDVAGRVTPLGAAAEATGDPTAPAAVVAAGGKPLPEVDGEHVGSTFARLERRASGRPPVVLRTAEQLARDVGLPAGAPLLVQRMAHSADGRLLAVALDVAATRVFPQGFSGVPAASPSGAVVVLERTGRVVGARRATAGRGVRWIRWSPDGRLALGETVATQTLNFSEHALTYWDLRSPAVDIRLPGAFPNTLANACAWAPTGGRLLCGDDRGWFDVDVASRSATPLSGVTGRPLAWLP